MVFGNPSPTPADVSFRLLGIPVRIQLFFWIVTLLLGPQEPKQALIWITCVLVSLLVHEFGHALLQRHYGGTPRIVLYGFGGLAYGDGVQATPARQILISLAGPFAGFALVVVTGIVITLLGHPPDWLALPFNPGAFPLFDSPYLNYFLFALFLINIWWGLLNLLPIYPLDGGHVSREVLTLIMQPRAGIVLSLWISVACAAAVAAFFLVTRLFFNVLLFGMLAYNSFQALQAYKNARRN